MEMAYSLQYLFSPAKTHPRDCLIHSNAKQALQHTPGIEKVSTGNVIGHVINQNTPECVFNAWFRCLIPLELIFGLIISTAVMPSIKERTGWTGLLTKPLGFPGAMASKKGLINLYFLSVVFKLSQKNDVSLLFSELWCEGSAAVAVWLKEVAALKWAVRCCFSPAFQCLRFTSEHSCGAQLCAGLLGPQVGSQDFSV